MPRVPERSSSSSTVLTETGLRDEVPGHGEHVLLARLVVADGLGIHLGVKAAFAAVRVTLARYPSLLTGSLRRRAEDTSPLSR